MFALLGLTQSVAYPSSISAVSNWFGKERRGLVLGIWGTCASTGNVIAAFLTSYLLTEHQLSWEATFAILGSCSFVMCLFTYLMLTEHPEDKCIRIPEDGKPYEFDKRELSSEIVQ